MVETSHEDRGDTNPVSRWMTREQAIPKFSGEASHFVLFKFTFERHMSMLEQSSNRGRKMREEEKLLMLEMALPEKHKRRLILAQQSGKGVTYSSYMRELETLLGPTQESEVMKKWNEISMRFAGRITSIDLSDFELEFDQLRQQLPELTDRECLRHLMTRLPQQLVNYVHDEELRLQNTSPQVQVIFPDDMTELEAKRNIDGLMRVNSVKVTKREARNFVVTLSDHADVKKILAVNGKGVRGSTETIKTQEVRRQLDLTGVFEYLRRRLISKDRADQAPRPFYNDRNRSPNRDNRFVRGATNDPPTQEDKTKPKEGGVN